MAQTPTVTKELQAALRAAVTLAEEHRHEYVTLEHLLLAFLSDKWAIKALRACGADTKRLAKKLREFLDESMERLPEAQRLEVQQTLGVSRVLQRAAIHVLSSEQKAIDVASVLVAMFREQESHALYLLRRRACNACLNIVNYVSHGIRKDAARLVSEEPHVFRATKTTTRPRSKAPGASSARTSTKRPRRGASIRSSAARSSSSRTIRVLCRRRKNNPLFVESPAWARPPSPRASPAETIVEGTVPEVLKGATIFSLDMGALLAGTKFRGQFEAPQGRAQEAQGPRRRDPLHRRDPHHRRRGH
ncbi:MAG: Clp protease N-terminal domain-containing protein [Polyangiales bacterium]